jgi:hypothetical protein
MMIFKNNLRQAGRTPPEGLLPEDIELPKQDCLQQNWG